MKDEPQELEQQQQQEDENPSEEITDQISDEIVDAPSDKLGTGASSSAAGTAVGKLEEEEGNAAQEADEKEEEEEEEEEETDVKFFVRPTDQLAQQQGMAHIALKRMDPNAAFAAGLASPNSLPQNAAFNEKGKSHQKKKQKTRKQAFFFVHRKAKIKLNLKKGYMPMFPGTKQPVLNKNVYDVDLETLEEKPWRRPDADATDYFNYGFNEETWNMYLQRQAGFRNQHNSRAKIRVFTTMENDHDAPPELKSQMEYNRQMNRPPPPPGYPGPGGGGGPFPPRNMYVPPPHSGPGGRPMMRDERDRYPPPPPPPPMFGYTPLPPPGYGMSDMPPPSGHRGPRRSRSRSNSKSRSPSPRDRDSRRDREYEDTFCLLFTYHLPHDLNFPPPALSPAPQTLPHL